jgi:antitoxin (DNA-binding transcriptional repressor) of toxin-antitoxin stability system
MHHMRKATVRDLRYRFPIVEELLREGKEIQITKRKHIIARLLPPAVSGPIRMPDFRSRMRAIFGNKKLKISGAKLIAQDRERF